jgi:thioredoxin-related protein
VCAVHHRFPVPEGGVEHKPIALVAAAAPRYAVAHTIGRSEVAMPGTRPLFRAALFACLALGALACGAARAQDVAPHAIKIPPWFTQTFLDFREDVADAARQGKRLLVYFGQDGCPYCKLLMETTFAETRIAEKAKRHFLAVEINLWGDREVTWVDGRRMTEKELGRALKVQFTPTVLMFDEKGNVVARLNGYFPANRLEAALDFVAQKMEAKQSFAAYLQSAVKEDAAPTLADHPLFIKPPYDLAAARRGGKPLLVIFERPRCASCDELHRDGLRRPEVERLLRRFTVARLDASAATAVTTPDGRATDSRTWARALGLPYVPALVFFDAKGVEVFRVEAYVRPFHLASALDYVASGAYREQPSFQRFIQARAEKMREHGERVELWK